MALTPVRDTPGLWRADDWQKNKPGVYALIVGVSEYPFLGDGKSAVEETFGLEQLISSAGTAARFFDWLRRHFKYGDMQLVWCKLLLSPTASEKATLEADGLTH